LEEKDLNDYKESSRPNKSVIDKFKNKFNKFKHTIKVKTSEIKGKLKNMFHKNFSDVSQ
jgi:hypothetical protein